MAAILYSAILNSAIVDSAIVFKTLTQTNSIWLKFIQSDSTWWWQPSCIQPFYTKNTSLIHSDSTLIMAAILNSAKLDSDTAILDSDTLLSSLRFTQKHSHSTLTLTQTNSIWLKFIHSDSTWWCQPSWILPSWIQPFCTKKPSLIDSDSTWWWQPSWILPSWIQTPCYLLSDSLKNILTPLHSDSN